MAFKVKSGVEHTSVTLRLSTREAEAGNFEAKIVYISSSRPTRATE